MTDSKPSAEDVALRIWSLAQQHFHDSPEFVAAISPMVATSASPQPDPLGYALAIEKAAGLRDDIADLIGARPMSSIHSALCEYANAIRSITPPADWLAAVLVMPKVRAVIRQAMAAYQMAYAEADRDVETPEEADRIAGLWFGKWMVESYPLSHETEAHSGDCTKQPWSCLRCHAEEALASVDASLKEWDRRAALAALVQP